MVWHRINHPYTCVEPRAVLHRYMAKSRPDLISPEDYEFMEQNPYGDPNFNPDHNKAVIASTIEKGKRYWRIKKKEYEEKTKERAVAVTAYLKNITQGGGVTNITNYFGKREMARLRGEEIVSQLKANPELVEKLKNLHKGQKVSKL